MTDRFLDLQSSPLARGVSPVRIRYRDAGSGPPVVILHGGWGYDVYSFDRQLAGLNDHRVVIPDRTGYGQSGRLNAQPPDFHQRAAEETLAVLDMLKLDRAALWGHSDGAVIALRVGLMAPERVRGIVAEATHFFRRKPRSREFFETMRDAPDTLGERVVVSLKGDHGDRWRALIMTNGSAWLRIADEASSDRSDFYDGRLSDLQVPVLVIHGAQDPRTESGEVSALCAALDSRSRALRQASRVVILADGGDSPHSERATADRVTRDALDFLVRLPSVPKEPPALARAVVGPEP